MDAVDFIFAPDYSFARFLFQRMLGAIYLVAFLVALNQFRPLLGERGLLPVTEFMQAVPFRRSPSLFYFHYSDRFFTLIAWLGLILAVLALSGLSDAGPLWVSMLVWFLLWALYQSIVNVGQSFYSFGWESLLLEAGFLAIFLGPTSTTPPAPMLWLIRWLLFRVEFGAGLIKMRGDECWRRLTCLDYHHETQPMPNPLSWYFHHLPKPLHRLEVAGNHFTQLIVPFGLFAPQPVASVCAAIIVLTQSWLVLSGNFSWLNVLTITLGIASFDNQAFTWQVSASTWPLSASPTWHTALVALVFALTLVLSYWPVRNMISGRQVMNRSFNPLHLVNTYGAFGSVTKKRYEVVIEGSASEAEPMVWKEYEFKGKPGDVQHRPRQFAPYHLRLDWLMWFAALRPMFRPRWLLAFVEKLLENDRATLSLLRVNPFPDGPPKYVRARVFRYRFSTPTERRETGAFWVRTFEHDYLAPTALGHESAGPCLH